MLAQSVVAAAAVLPLRIPAVGGPAQPPAPTGPNAMTFVLTRPAEFAP